MQNSLKITPDGLPLRYGQWSREVDYKLGIFKPWLFFLIMYFRLVTTSQMLYFTSYFIA